jgi:hypothetical protein
LVRVGIDAQSVFADNDIWALDRESLRNRLSAAGTCIAGSPGLSVGGRRQAWFVLSVISRRLG